MISTFFLYKEKRNISIEIDLIGTKEVPLDDTLEKIASHYECERIFLYCLIKQA